MNTIIARGTCDTCRNYEEVVASDRENGMILINHQHGMEHKHPFSGEISFVRSEKKKVEQPKKRR